MFTKTSGSWWCLSQGSTDSVCKKSLIFLKFNVTIKFWQSVSLLRCEQKKTGSQVSSDTEGGDAEIQKMNNRRVLQSAPFRSHQVDPKSVMSGITALPRFESNVKCKKKLLPYQSRAWSWVAKRNVPDRLISGTSLGDTIYFRCSKRSRAIGKGWDGLHKN